MNWLLQQPLVIIVAGLVAELLLFFVLQTTGKRWVVGAMAGVALLLVAMLGLERLIVTPEEAIRAKLYELARQSQENDIEAIVANISRRAPDKQAEARAIFKRVTLEEVKVKQVADLTVADPPERASLRVRVLVVGGMGGIQHQRGVREFDVDLVLEDETWKVRGFEDLGDPLRPGS